ncbi:hypothetical protein RUND412_011372, partial [Rhizina undulata]
MGNIFSSANAPAKLFAGFPPVEPAGIDSSSDPRGKKLKSLLKKNHDNHSVMYSRLRFHNHCPHILGSAYLLGATSEHLQALYDEEYKSLEPWPNSPGPIVKGDWRDYLGDRDYQRAYLDFFEDEVSKAHGDWKKVVMKYTLTGPEPLIYGGIGGLGHPLIHLGYAFELDSCDVATEALALLATNYDFLHKYFDEDFPTFLSHPQPPAHPVHPPPENTTASPLEILSRIRSDTRFDDTFSHPGSTNISKLFSMHEELVLSYYHQLHIQDLIEKHRLLNEAATWLLCAIHEPGKPEYDFFICHLVTVSYAVRTLMPLLPENYCEGLLSGHWLFIVIVYIIQLRPEIRKELVEEVKINGRDWDDVVRKIFSHEKKEGKVEDVHYLKMLRAAKDSARLWKDYEEFYLKAACKFGWEFKEWTGFGSEEEME